MEFSHLLIISIFLIFSIFLFVLAVIVFDKAYHLKGQRFVTGILFCFGCTYLFEVVLYLLPMQYVHYVLVWIVHTFSLLGLCLITHYLYFLIKKHTILNLQFVPYIFYLYFFLYVVIVGPMELFFGDTTYVRSKNWYVRENFSPSILFYIVIPIMLIKMIYLITKGLQYAPSERRKKLYISYLMGGIVTILLSFVPIFLIGGKAFPPDVAALICFIPLLLIIGIENYIYSPGFAKHYNKIIELSPIALVVLNRDFEIVEINSRAKQWFNMEKYDQLLKTLKSEENIREIMQFLTDLQEKKEVDDYRISLNFDKKIHFSISASIVELEDEYYYYIMLRDITNEYEQEQRNYYLAYHDVLTTLYNRTYFTSYVGEKLNSFDSTKMGAIILSDLNFFKKINDTFGHHIGDEVLIHTGKLISSRVSEPNVVARLGGDEFIVYLDDIESEGKLQNRIEDMRQLFKATPYINDTLEIEVIPSFGYALITEGMNFKELYQKADEEMYKDKRRIKEHYSNQSELLLS